MKTTFAFWENRIAPFCDPARQVYIVEVEFGRIVREDQEPLTGDLPVQKALRLAELGVGTLICGAISRPLQEMVIGCGIQVVPFVSGDLREVIRVWFSSGFAQSAFAMPGCFGRRRHRFGGRRSINREVNIMNGMGQGGRGMGGGQGQGQGGRRAGGGALGCGFGGGGRGWRNMYYATGQPGWMRFSRYATPYGYPALYPAPDPEMEKQALKSRAEALQPEMDSIKKRLADIEAGTADQ